MLTVPQYEDGKDQLQALIGWFNETPSPVRNEATTRLHLIDALLLQVLGWPKSECIAEQWQDGTYTDYQLGDPRRLVVEAKREGQYLTLPSGFSDRTCRISTLAEGGTDTESAIRQAVGYCGERGIPFGAVTNGHQVIGFIGSRQDGVPPLDGLCVVFPSLQAMLEDFRTLWECLSPPGVVARNLDRLLRAQRLPPPPPKLSQGLFNYPGFKRRNGIQTELKILGGMFIEDIVKNPELQDEFLKECYCPSEALSQYALISKRLMRARYDLASEKGVQPKRARGKKALARELTRDLKAGNISLRPVILLGDVGVGKTTFIQHLIRVEARELLERALVLCIDFGEEPALPTNLTPYVVRQIESQLLERYEFDVHADDFVRAAYHGQLRQFSRGIYGPLAASDPDQYKRHELEFLEAKLADTQSHLQACLVHVTATQQRQVVIVLDNVDQRPEPFQDEVFLMAQGFAARWPASVFVALRPDTFYRSSASGSLSGYQTQVFTIAPPRVERAVDKRLRFAKAQLKSKKTLEVLGDGVTFESQSLDMYLEALLQSFARNRDLCELVDNLSNGNIRRAFDFLKAFIGSGHVDTDKILGAMREEGRYLVAVHEFLRAVVFGDNEYYDPSASFVPNLFDISSRDGREHFLLLLLLAYIQRIGESSAGHGYVGHRDIQSFGLTLGFHEDQVGYALQRAESKRLLDRPALSGDDDQSDRYRITTVGAYAIKRLATSFAYVDAISVDTPIVDDSVKSGVQPAASINDRLARAEVFVGYLDSQWQGFDDELITFSWPQASAQLKSEIGEVRTRAGRRAIERPPRGRGESPTA